MSNAYTYSLGEQRIILAESVIEIFSRHRQKIFDSEAGGLLFAKFDLPDVHIVEATAPTIADKRSRISFIPNRTLQRRIIQSRFKLDRHLVGEWHTHPELVPTPSAIDYRSMSDSFTKSNHELKCFIMVIVGNRMDSLNLWVSAHDGVETHRLIEA